MLPTGVMKGSNVILTNYFNHYGVITGNRWSKGSPTRFQKVNPVLPSMVCIRFRQIRALQVSKCLQETTLKSKHGIGGVVTCDTVSETGVNLGLAGGG